MIFENNQIDLSELPQSDSIDFQALKTSFKTLQYVQWSIFFIILLIGGFVFYKINDLPPISLIIFLIALFLLFIYILIIIHIGFPYKGYAIREHDVHYKTGLINRKVITIPVNRIQHMEIRQGVIARLLKLAKLKLFTAGDSSSDLSLKGISPETAQEIKELLTEKINQNDQD